MVCYLSVRIRVADGEEYGIEKSGKINGWLPYFVFPLNFLKWKQILSLKVLSSYYISVYLLAILITLKDWSICNIQILYFSFLTITASFQFLSEAALLETLSNFRIAHCYALHDQQFACIFFLYSLIALSLAVPLWFCLQQKFIHLIF